MVTLQDPQSSQNHKDSVTFEAMSLDVKGCQTPVFEKSFQSQGFLVYSSRAAPKWPKS